MKFIFEPTVKRKSKFLLFLYRCLIIVFLLLGFFFIVGTLYGVYIHLGVPSFSQETYSQSIDEGQTFTGIGPTRVPILDPQPGVVIIFVTFIYYPSDKAFSEELALRVKDFRQIIRDYLSVFSVSELQKMNENVIKAELLNQFNAILMLGQIDTLYFSDFMIVE